MFFFICHMISRLTYNLGPGYLCAHTKIGTNLSVSCVGLRLPSTFLHAPKSGHSCVFSALSGHINLMLEETFFWCTHTPSNISNNPNRLFHPLIIRRPSSQPIPMDKARGFKLNPKITPRSSESLPLETLNQEVNPDHLKEVQSRASRGEEREIAQRSAKRAHNTQARLLKVL